MAHRPRAFVGGDFMSCSLIQSHDRTLMMLVIDKPLPFADTNILSSGIFHSEGDDHERPIAE
jgi:hypothetical protein